MKFVFNPLSAFWILIKSLLKVIFPVATLLFVFRKESAFLELGIVFSFILQLPLMYLFVQYYLNDRNSSFEISYEEKTLIWNKAANRITISFSSVKHIEYVLPPGLAGRRPHRLYPQGDYFYIRFHLANGIIFTVTSLLLRHQYLKFEEIATHQKIKFLPLL